MKTKNKIISIFMCLCLALLSGCSQDSGGQPDAGTAGTVNTPSAGNTNKEESGLDAVTTEGGAADANSDEAVTTEAENQPADERFAYYDLLSEEYDKSGKLYRIGPGVVGDYGNDALVINGKAIIIDENFDWSNANNNIKVKIYDCETKSDIADFQFDNFADYTSESLFYADVDGGYIYRTPQKFYSGTFYKYDIGGNLISQAETAEGEVLDLLFTDGTFITHSGRSDEKYYLYSEDWKTKTELPDLQYDAGHGIMEKITEYDVAAKYKNKIYVYAVRASMGHEGYYCLNTDTGTWEHVESELQDTPYIEPTDFNSYYLNYSTVGRYFLFEGYSTRSRSPGGIYDMETDTIIANTPMRSYFVQNYKGGKSTLYINDYGQLRRSRYPSDGSEEKVETILESEELAYVSFSHEFKYAVNEEYYLFIDKYGAFLCTYEGGEDGEITVMMFEN